ncbi:hypothetical protein PG994_005356 [Apiospora phragmitis]|uniref:Uncharacterized protein n=1 Tax=Apiospora phragmitis TaxID=2905665 RepID=A0ABR1VC10_9PEZI
MASRNTLLALHGQHPNIACWRATTSCNYFDIVLRTHLDMQMWRWIDMFATAKPQQSAMLDGTNTKA